MDLIYAHSYATIIAAGGEDADFGLPGVPRSRLVAKRHSLDDMDMVEVKSRYDIIASLTSTKWAKRGM